ncbi:MAG: hypothetical protein R3A13_10725 [Bdellovibrionota bacterium]
MTDSSRNFKSLLLPVLSGVFCAVYAYAFWKSVSPYWFHPHWTTDDALQQLFPFHEVTNPGIFSGDIIYDLIIGYLAPVHYWLSYGITYLTGDPMMMGHWVMLIQALIAVGFLFLAVREYAGTTAGFFAAAWLLHTRHIMQRLTAGLPRGWAASLFAVFLFFLFKKNHKAILVTLFVGCLLHPPATLLCAVCYGSFLLWGVASKKTRAEFLKPLKILLLLSPVYAVVTLTVVHRPDHIGQMVSYQQASEMPEFQRPLGRFPFVPLSDAGQELRSFSFQAFIGRFYNPGRWWKRNMPTVVIFSLIGIVLAGFIRKRKSVPAEVWCFLIATLVVYFASRLLAFKLYVPNRHLQFPMAFFFITAFTIGGWRAFHGALDSIRVRSSDLTLAWKSALALFAIAGLVYAGSEVGLNGAANFNYAYNKKGHVFNWIRNNTPESALIAGHPTFIDAVQLFAKRRGYATTETAHPFYPKYYAEIKRRLEISLRAHYAKNLKQLLEIVEPEGIDYFVFERKYFYPDELDQAKYFPGLNQVVSEVTSGSHMQYAYRELPEAIDLEKAPYMPFKDDQSALVDIKKLKEYLKAN